MSIKLHNRTLKPYTFSLKMVTNNAKSYAIFWWVRPNLWIHIISYPHKPNLIIFATISPSLTNGQFSMFSISLLNEVLLPNQEIVSLCNYNLPFWATTTGVGILLTSPMNYTKNTSISPLLLKFIIELMTKWRLSENDLSVWVIF